MEAHIISREIIRPSSSTPHHLRSYKLSRVDKLFFDISFPIFLFYSGATKNSDHLKTSLSKKLSLYYPFAGRVKDHLSVDFDDYGVDFVGAHVAGDMSQILKQPEVNLLEQLMLYMQNELSSTQFNLAVQIPPSPQTVSLEPPDVVIPWQPSAASTLPLVVVTVRSRHIYRLRQLEPHERLGN
ncbi:hypothetical protein LWI28_021083 [Acer negundo]|uniref:Uncharacterized protein n=1 Tax=Acer negundo TaxID=4023 RepID=A0AAD5IK50_ACENE|nr:hypothetical protein LWI28_021083 [Acer negundo]